MKSILRIVRSSNVLFGTALGDPYLAFAIPLALLTSVLDVAIAENNPGNLAFGLPIKSPDPPHFAASRRIFAAFLEYLLSFDRLKNTCPRISTWTKGN
jgi:hypothetical protein